MANDNAVTRLLFAILSQKCLKDIDWNKVAREPILRGEITNGHAARMRYSRFKKQMEGGTTSTTPRRPRDPSSVKKSQARLQKSPTKSKGKVKDGRSTDPDLPLTPDASSTSGSASAGLARVKLEPQKDLRDMPDDTADEESIFSRSMTAATPERNMLDMSFHSANSNTSGMSFVKSEYDPGSTPQTPAGPASHSQCVGHDHTPAGSFGPASGMGGNLRAEQLEDVIMGGYGDRLGLFGEVSMRGQHQHPHHSLLSQPHSYSQSRSISHSHPHHASFHGHPSHHARYLTHHAASFGPTTTLPDLSMPSVHLGMNAGVDVDMPNNFDNLWTPNMATAHQQNRMAPEVSQRPLGGAAKSSLPCDSNATTSSETGVKKESRWEEDYTSI